MTGPTGKRRRDPRASLRPHCDHWHRGRAGRAATLGITTKESA